MKPVFRNEQEALSAPYCPLKDYVNVKPVQHKPKQKIERGSIWKTLLLCAVGFGFAALMLWSASNAN